MSEINLKRNVIVSSTFRILNMVIMFVTSILSTRYLGVELKGQYSYLITLVTFGWMTLDVGISRTYPYTLRQNKGSLSALYTWSLVSFAVELLLFGVLGTLFLSQVNSLASFQFTYLIWWIFITLLIISQLTNQMHMTYMGLDRVMTRSLTETVFTFLCFIFVAIALIFFKDANRLLVMLLTLLIPFLAICIPYCGKLFSNFSFKNLKLPFIMRTYKLGLSVFFSSLFITLLIRADIVILRNLTNYSSVGIYSLSASIVDMLQIASNMIGTLLLVKLSDTAEPELKWTLMKKIFMLFFVFLSVANLTFALIGKPLIRIVYGAAFEGSYYSSLWLIPATFGLSFGSLFNTYLWSKGFPVVSIVVPFLALLLNIGLNFWLVPLMGISGSALASSICYCLWFLAILLYEQHLSGGRMLRYLIPRRGDWGAVWKEGVLGLTSAFKGSVK